MATQQRIAGTCFVAIDGVQYALRGALRVNPLDSIRESVVGMDRVHGFKEMPRAPSIEAEFTDLGSMSVKALGALSGATITAELANGKVFILVDAFTSGDIQIDPADGKYQAKFEGFSCREVTA